MNFVLTKNIINYKIMLRGVLSSHINPYTVAHYSFYAVVGGNFLYIPIGHSVIRVRFKTKDLFWGEKCSISIDIAETPL